jgi:conjugal transfer pilus assembly protein TraE
MENSNRTRSLQESAKIIVWQQMSIAMLVLALIVLVLIVYSQSKIVVLQTPGMPSDAIIQKTSLDKGAQRAVLAAVTSNLAQVNPANIEYQKAFLQAFLAPAAYTKISSEIDTQSKRLLEQRELGSYYFVLKSWEYDTQLDRHFVLGDVHTVNAAKDTAQPYVFEYQMHVENYRPVIDDVKSYAGERAHNSEWMKSQK